MKVAITDFGKWDCWMLKWCNKGNMDVNKSISIIMARVKRFQISETISINRTFAFVTWNFLSNVCELKTKFNNILSATVTQLNSLHLSFSTFTSRSQHFLIHFFHNSLISTMLSHYPVLLNDVKKGDCASTVRKHVTRQLEQNNNNNQLRKRKRHGERERENWKFSFLYGTKQNISWHHARNKV